jgi:organic hydroperoxide reductase OsmC/OhrA
MPEQVLESNATIRWLTHPPQGTPRLTVGSLTFAATPLAIDRDAPHPLATSPGELMAGAFGSVFAWLLAEELVREQAPPAELVVEVGLTAERAAGADHPEPALRAITCHTEARLAGFDRARLQALCERVSAVARRSLALRDDLAVQVQATVVGG